VAQRRKLVPQVWVIVRPIQTHPRRGCRALCGTAAAAEETAAALGLLGAWHARPIRTITQRRAQLAQLLIRQDGQRLVHGDVHLTGVDVNYHRVCTATGAVRHAAAHAEEVGSGCADDLDLLAGQHGDVVHDPAEGEEQGNQALAHGRQQVHVSAADAHASLAQQRGEHLQQAQGIQALEQRHQRDV
jgi:hypothetical protein